VRRERIELDVEHTAHGASEFDEICNTAKGVNKRSEANGSMMPTLAQEIALPECLEA
jgi:hypothetical protein